MIKSSVLSIIFISSFSMVVNAEVRSIHSMKITKGTCKTSSRSTDLDPTRDGRQNTEICLHLKSLYETSDDSYACIYIEDDMAHVKCNELQTAQKNGSTGTFFIENLFDTPNSVKVIRDYYINLNKEF